MNVGNTQKKTYPIYLKESLILKLHTLHISTKISNLNHKILTHVWYVASMSFIT